MSSPQIHLRIDPSLKLRYYAALEANNNKATYHLINEIIKYTETHEKKKKAAEKELTAK